MIIGFDANRLFHDHGAMGSYGRCLMQGLADACPDHRYILYTPHARLIAPDDPILTSGRYKVVSPSGLFRDHFWRGLWLGHHLKKDGVQIYHGLGQTIPISTKVRGISTLVTVHSLWFRQGGAAARYWLRDRKTAYACRHSDHVVAVSQAVRSELIKAYGIADAKVSVVYPAAREVFYRPMPPAEARRLLADRWPALPPRFVLNVGTAASHTDWDTIARALAQLPEADRPVLAVAGYGHVEQQAIEACAARHGLGAYVLQLGYVTDDRLLQALYTAAATFVYPSLYDGFAQPVVEASLQGCPVLAYRTSSLPEAAGPSACLVEPQQPDELAHALDRLLSDAGVHDRIADTGRQYAHVTFHPAELARQMLSIYYRLHEP